MMFASVDTRVPGEVEREVSAIHRRLFPQGGRERVMRAFEWATLCFEGFYEGYQAVDARYHDFEHTLQGTLCFARLIEGRQKAGAAPEVLERMFEMGMLAILFHDTGYLKERGDNVGTGAKYTLVHVVRSAEFARQFLTQHGYSESEIAMVQRMISCTGVNADLARIDFQNEVERILGYALATADLLGQMAAKDYVDKLPILFTEFAEAAQVAGEKAARFAIYKSAEDLMRGTEGFWRNYVLPKIDRDFMGLYQFLRNPFPDGPNEYIHRIEANLERLRHRLDRVAASSQP